MYRAHFLPLALAAFLPVLAAQAHEPPKTACKVGLTRRHFLPAKIYNWRNAAKHELLTAIWYPAGPDAVEQPQWFGPASSPLFSAGNAAPDAKLAGSPAKLPLVVLSHSTGASALMIGWLGAALAQQGYIAAAVDHPGNNATADYTVEGFTFWWERATDLSVVINRILEDPTFGPRIDPKRIGAAGFSLGGYTVIEIAGGITVPANYDSFCQSAQADASCKNPPEFPNLRAKAAQLAKLAGDDGLVKDAYAHASDSRRDPRIRAVFAISPSLGPAFDAPSLEKISIPVEIVASDTDQTVPLATNAKFFAAHIPGAKLTLLPGGIGHYAFLATCTPDASKINPALCKSAGDTDRDTVHARTAQLAVAFFNANLR